MKVLRFFAYFSAFLSLAISVVLVILWCSNVGGLKVVNLNTFVGVTVALLGIIVTLAIAWQIYNAVEMRSKVEELKQLESRLKKQEKTLLQLRYSYSASINRLSGNNSFQAENMTHAFMLMLSSLENDLQLDKPENVEYLLNMMKTIVTKISPNTKYSEKYYNRVIKANKVIQSLDNYNLIMNRYESIYQEFISKVVKA